MHGNTSKILLVVTIFFAMLTPAYTALGATDKIALSMDRQVYSVGMKVTIAGQVLGSFDPDLPARISVIGPSGNSHHSTTVSLDSSGGFTHQFTINGDSSLVGRNTLEVTHQTVSGSVSGKLTFEVRDHASIIIQMNKDSYMLGEDVMLQGKVSPVLPDSQVLIQVFNPKNQAWSFEEISFNNISPDGQFTVALGNLAGQKSIIGSYTVKAFYADSAATVTRSFIVTDSDSTSQSSKTEKDEENVQDTSSVSAPSKVEVVTEDSTSVSAAEVAKETVVQSEIKNENEQAQEFTYIVLIKDLDGITVSLSWTKGTLAPNQSLTMEQSWIPEISGEYTAEIFVWRSLNDPEALSGVIVKKIIVE
jgi:hypothetical protein